MSAVPPVMEVYPYAWAFFVPFFLLTSFIVPNLFIGVTVNAMAAAMEDDAHRKHEMIIDELRALRGEIAKLRDR